MKKNQFDAAWVKEEIKKVARALENMGLPIRFQQVTCVGVFRQDQKAMGQITYDKKTKNFKIDLWQDLLDTGKNDYIDGVIAHELIHTCPHALNHNLRFRHYLKKAKAEYPKARRFFGRKAMDAVFAEP